jgi:hypothetical protein
MVGKAAARKILQTYGKAWVTRDTGLVLSIFTKDATYQEAWYKPVSKGHKGIAKYWDNKVVKGQSKIKFRILNYWTVKDTMIGAWEAWFYNKVKRKNRHIKGVGIFETKGGKVKSLREIWQKAK